jgi:hypothetical protein
MEGPGASLHDLDVLRELDKELHDLCQPLTVLQCRLEYGVMCGDAEALKEAVEGGLLETVRMFERIGLMREHLLTMERASAAGGQMKGSNDGGSGDCRDATECGSGECGCSVTGAAAG